MLSINQKSTLKSTLDANASCAPFFASPPLCIFTFPNKLILLVVLSFFNLLPAAAADNGDTIVVTAEDIKAMQALKIADVLNNVPGVKAGNSSVGIHGSYKVKVLVDGRPINDPTSNHGAINWDLVSPDDVLRIEILKGKGGLAYGQDASGGVILITTQKNRQLTGNVKVHAGNFDTQNLTAAVSNATGKFTVGASGGYETTDGYKINNDKERYQAGIELGYAPAEDKTFGFTVDYLADERGFSGLPEYPTPFSRKESRNHSCALAADLFDINSNTHYNEGYSHNTDPSRDLDKDLRVSKFGQDLTTYFDTTQRGGLDCGASVTWDQAKGTDFDRQKEHSISLFASQSLTFPTLHTTVAAGLRGIYHSNFDNSVNPEIKLIYKQKIWRLTTAYSHTNNIPSFYQRYRETVSTLPNPELDMEQADNYSLSFFSTPHEAVSVSLTGFYNILTDRITYITVDEGISQYQNFGEVLYTGGDTCVSIKFNQRLKVKTSYTYLEAKDQETDLYIPGKARHDLNLDIYLQPLKALSLVSTISYTSKVYRNKSNTETVPEYVTTDLRAEYSFKRFSLFGEVENLFDKTYYYADGLLAPPQTWLIGVNWRI